jgi:23S rRNA (cytosine1962-C5)-methyltransferase
MSVAHVVLLPKKARPFYGRHPWVFPGAISHIEGDPEDGDEVILIAHGGQPVARGFFNSQSKLRVRLYSWKPELPIDRAFFHEKISEAVRLRNDLGLMDPDGACRLVNSEGDGLSGLTIDRFGGWLTVQLTSLGLAKRKDMIVECLLDIVRPRGIYLRTEKGVSQLEGLDLRDGPVWGEEPNGPVRIKEAGLEIFAHLTEGQKTGYYLDQRDNRQLAGRLAHGRTVLDAFCYSGGFALHAAKSGAKSVVALDQSEGALDLARKNASHNGFSIEFHKAEVFAELARRKETGEKYGMVILDPPKFARHRGAVDDALAGYRRLQTLGMELLEPEGYLVVCCCSGLIAMEQLEEIVQQVATTLKREVQLLSRTGAAPDHPVSITCRESGYLKCLIMRVLDKSR